MRYTLAEIRKMSSKQIETLLEEQYKRMVANAVMNQDASRKYSINIDKFEQVQAERNNK